jgi:predicted alpha/beta-fold hydrolase
MAAAADAEERSIRFMETSRRPGDGSASISRSGESMAGPGEFPIAFSPSPWLPGPHLQTIWGNLTRSRRLVPYRRQALATPDGDELLLDRVDGPAGSPRLLVLHGLEGSSESVYVQGLMALARARGWRGIALNFRSCARRPEDHDRWIPNRRPRLYHSGETTDLDFVVSTLAAEEAEEASAGTKSPAPLFAAGVSLGGNVLLKWLGENPAQRTVAVVSVPFDLGAGGRYMETGFGPLYVRHLLSTLSAKAVDLAARFPEAAALLDLPRLSAARSFFEFDDAGTAPLHGFAGAADYYARASSLGFVGRIATPTLAISAADDPFLPRTVLDDVAREKSPAVELLVTRRGGHAGFVGGTIRPRYWAEERAVEWLAGRHPPPGRL